MSNITNMEEVLKKIENIRDMLKLSDEIIPFLGDLFKFMKDVIPLMLAIKSSIKDSASKLPTASENISTVSATTELATHQMLDKLDIIMDRMDKISASLGDSEKDNEKRAIVSEVQNEVNDIISALQFQDITSQQLEHANRILEAIYEKFLNLFDAIRSVKSHTFVGEEIIGALEDAQREKIEKESEEFHKETEDKIRNKGISQSDIDRMFK